MANLLDVCIEVHLSQMEDYDQVVGRRRAFNEGAVKIPYPLHVLFEFNPKDGRGHVSKLARVH